MNLIVATGNSKIELNKEKRMIKLITLLSIASLCLGMSYADGIKAPHITVFGTATKKVTPNSMSWNLTVKNKGRDLQEVAEHHTKCVAAVFALLKTIKVPTKEMQAAKMEFGENFMYLNHSQVKDGYFASTEIFFKIKDFKKYSPLWLGLSRLENVSVNDVYYGHLDRIKLQNETRKQALLAAKKKAIVIAETLDSRIGAPLVIEEVRVSQKVFNGGAVPNIVVVNEGGSDKQEGVALGKIPITMKVKISFKLITDER